MEVMREFAAALVRDYALNAPQNKAEAATAFLNLEAVALLYFLEELEYRKWSIESITTGQSCAILRLMEAEGRPLNPWACPEKWEQIPIPTTGWEAVGWSREAYMAYMKARNELLAAEGEWGAEVLKAYIPSWPRKHAQVMTKMRSIADYYAEDYKSPARPVQGGEDVSWKWKGRRRLV